MECFILLQEIIQLAQALTFEYRSYVSEYGRFRAARVFLFLTVIKLAKCQGFLSQQARQAKQG